MTTRVTLTLLLALALPAGGQAVKSHEQAAPPPVEEAPGGDMPSDPGPLASDLSGDLRTSAIHAAVKRVADWQLARIEGQFNRDWRYAVLYVGLLAASRTLHDPVYEKQVERVAEENHWSLGPRKLHADDQAIAQAYLSLYEERPDPQRMRPTLEQFDQIMIVPDDADLPMWWWCDALFMAPPVWSKLTVLTHDGRYLNYMDHEWHIAADLLWDPKEALFYRDKSYFAKREKNGKAIFWSRGNGWVMAGIVRTLENMDENDSRREFYINKLQAMAAAIAKAQGADGLWRPGLLDPDAYPNPEVSGSSLFIYAMAWGLNHHLLEERQYLPVVRKGWAGVVRHVYADGRLGSIQPAGSGPSSYTPGSSFVFGTGAFLLAGSEVDRLAQVHHWR
jgi:unsaturated rhamnogalacturonyl hydrolase